MGDAPGLKVLGVQVVLELVAKLASDAIVAGSLGNGRNKNLFR